VSWATKKELVNLANTPEQRQYGCEFQGKFYFTAGPEEQKAFLKDPLRFLTNQRFPVEARLPVRLFPSDFATCGGKLGFKGFCPVNMLEGPDADRYIQGKDSLAVLFKERVYFFDSEDNLRKFMRRPWLYAKQTLPAKIPPRLQRVAAQRLADGSSAASSISYLEQSLSEMIVKALTGVDQYRATLVHPALSVANSCKAFVALHLKANNASAAPHVRERAAAKLQLFLDECAITEKIRAGAARGSAVSAARKSPRISETAALGQQFDKIRKEPKAYMVGKFLRPEPVPSK